MIDLRTRSREQRETIVPMINVAFLLLVFLMMVSVIAPSEGIEIDPPVSSFDDLDRSKVLIFIGPDGTLMRDQLKGDEVFEGLSNQEVSIRADARLDARVLARVVTRLAASGVSTITLATRNRSENPESLEIE